MCRCIKLVRNVTRVSKSCFKNIQTRRIEIEMKNKLGIDVIADRIKRFRMVNPKHKMIDLVKN